jgi:hypothetical protein
MRCSWFNLLSFPRYPMEATNRDAPIKMVLLAWRLLPSFEKINMSTPMRMPVVSLNGLLLCLNPQDWVTQSKAYGRANNMQTSC